MLVGNFYWHICQTTLRAINTAFIFIYQKNMEDMLCLNLWKKILYKISCILMVSGWKSICFSSAKSVGISSSVSPFFTIIRGQTAFWVNFPWDPCIEECDSVNKELAPKELSHLESYYFLCSAYVGSIISVRWKGALDLEIIYIFNRFSILCLIPHNNFFPLLPKS